MSTTNVLQVKFVVLAGALSRSAILEAAAELAVKQVSQKDYAWELKQQGVKRIVGYGIAVQGPSRDVSVLRTLLRMKILTISRYALRALETFVSKDCAVRSIEI